MVTLKKHFRNVFDNKIVATGLKAFMASFGKAKTQYK